MADPYDVVVAGGGIAGLTAGMVSARLGRRTLVLTGDVLGGNLLSIERIEGYPGYPDGIAGYELCPAVQAQAAEAGAEFAMTEVSALAPDGEGWRVHTDAGEHAARAVIVATGTMLKSLGVPGEERLFGRGVSRCASCDAPLLRGKPVAVIGGGDSALQEALTLAEAASSVTVLTRGAALRAQASFAERAAAHPRIAIRFNATVEEILGANTVSGVRVAIDGTAGELSVSGVFVYIGMRPNGGFLDGRVVLDGAGCISVDASMRTTLPGLLAAGTVRADPAGRAAASAGDGTTAAIAADRYLAGGAWRSV